MAGIAYPACSAVSESQDRQRHHWLRPPTMYAVSEVNTLSLTNGNVHDE